MVRAEDRDWSPLGVPHGGASDGASVRRALTPTNPTTTLFSPLALCAASIASAHFAAFFPMSCARTRPAPVVREGQEEHLARFVFGFSSRFVPAGGSRDVTAPTMETDAAEASDEPPSALRSENGVGSGACAGQGVLGNDGRLSDHRSPGTDRCWPRSPPPRPNPTTRAGPRRRASPPKAAPRTPRAPRRRSRSRRGDTEAPPRAARGSRSEKPSGGSGVRRGFFGGAGGGERDARVRRQERKRGASGVRVLPDGRVGGRIDALRRRVGIVVPRLFGVVRVPRLLERVPRRRGMRTIPSGATVVVGRRVAAADASERLVDDARVRRRAERPPASSARGHDGERSRLSGARVEGSLANPVRTRRGPIFVGFFSPSPRITRARPRLHRGGERGGGRPRGRTPPPPRAPPRRPRAITHRATRATTASGTGAGPSRR